MNTAELTAALAIAPAKLKEWLAAGLPCRKVGRGRQFDAAAVREWLVTTGRAGRRNSSARWRRPPPSWIFTHEPFPVGSGEEPQAKARKVMTWMH